MKLYLHRNGVTRPRLQRRTSISFVFNLNEKFCWGRLFFPPYSWFVDVCVGARVCACNTPPPPLCVLRPCRCVPMTPFQIRWQIATRKIMQMQQCRLPLRPAAAPSSATRAALVGRGPLGCEWPVAAHRLCVLFKAKCLSVFGNEN